MAKITEEILKMLDIDKNTIGDYSGYEKKGEDYILKLNNGSNRTYSPNGVFEGEFALSKIESLNIDGTKMFSDRITMSYYVHG